MNKYFTEDYQIVKNELLYLTPVVNDLLCEEYATPDVFMSNVDLVMEKYLNLPSVDNPEFREFLLGHDVMAYFDLSQIAAAISAWSNMANNVIVKLK